jgi:hypothetical protein
MKSEKKKQTPKSNLSKFQRFEIVTVNRKQLKNAPYNPRIIDEGAMKRLKAGIKKHGLRQPAVWNSRTGNIVSGHQRISILDELERREDYDLQVAVIDVDEAEEKALNVQMNNPSMMGEWDLEKLAALNIESGVSFEDMGFSKLDVDFLFDGDERFSEMFHDTPDVKQAKDTLRDIKKDRAEMAEKMKKEQSAAFYFTVVCESKDEKAQALSELGLPVYEQFISWSAVKRRLSTPTK